MPEDPTLVELTEQVAAMAGKLNALETANITLSEENQTLKREVATLATRATQQEHDLFLSDYKTTLSPHVYELFQRLFAFTRGEQVHLQDVLTPAAAVSLHLADTEEDNPALTFETALKVLLAEYPAEPAFGPDSRAEAPRKGSASGERLIALAEEEQRKEGISFGEAMKRVIAKGAK